MLDRLLASPGRLITIEWAMSLLYLSLGALLLITPSNQISTSVIGLYLLFGLSDNLVGLLCLMLGLGFHVFKHSLTTRCSFNILAGSLWIGHVLTLALYVQINLGLQSIYMATGVFGLVLILASVALPIWRWPWIAR